MTPLIIYERPGWARVTWTLAFWALLISPTSFLVCISIGLRSGFSNLILVLLPLCALITLVAAGRLWQGDRFIADAKVVLRADARGIHTLSDGFLAWQDFNRVRRVSLGNGGTIYQILRHPSDSVFAELQASQVFGDFSDLGDALSLAKETAMRETARPR